MSREPMPPANPSARGSEDRQPRAADRLRVAEATIAHVYQLAAKMRREEIEAAARIGRDAKLALRLSYKSSAFYRRVALLSPAARDCRPPTQSLAADDGDDVLAMWGLGGDALSDIGFPWLVTSTHAPRHRLALLKIGRTELGEMLARKRLLIDYVEPGDRGAARFVRFFGFANVGEGPQLAGRGALWAHYELRRPQ